MSKKITFSVSPKSVTKAIRELKAYKADFERKCDQVVQRVVQYGRDVAERKFAFAEYFGEKNISVTVEKTGTKYTIVANGEAVAFIEFGAGVHYNGLNGTYPIEKPAGIVGIGQYGKGKGKFDSWSYQVGNVWVTTYGNPAYMPMYFASVEIQARIKDAIREVFGDA